MVEQPTNPDNQPTVWQLVVSHPWGDARALTEYLNVKCDRWLASEHEADEEINRTHVHFSLVNYKHTKVSLTKEINKYWHGSDNFGILTMRPKGAGRYDETLLAQYVSKGREDAFSHRGYSYGYTPEQLGKFIDGYHGNQSIVYSKGALNQDDTNTKERVITKIQYKLKVESPAQQKVRKHDFVKMCIKTLKEKFPEKIYDPRDVFIVIRQHLIELNWTVGNYTVMEYYDTINRIETPGRWIDEMMGLLEKRKPR